MTKEIEAKELSALDKKLLRAANSGDRSPNALSAATNGHYTPEEAAVRLLDLLDENDWLSEANDRRLLILDARDFVGKLKEDWEDMRGVKGAAQAADVALKGMRFVAERLDKASVNVGDIEVTVSAFYAKVMAEAIAAAMTLAAKELSTTYDIPMEEVDGVFREALPAAVKEIDKNRGE